MSRSVKFADWSSLIHPIILRRQPCTVLRRPKDRREKSLLHRSSSSISASMIERIKVTIFFVQSTLTYRATQQHHLYLCSSPAASMTVVAVAKTQLLHMRGPVVEDHVD